MRGAALIYLVLTIVMTVLVGGFLAAHILMSVMASDSGSNGAIAAAYVMLIAGSAALVAVPVTFGIATWKIRGHGPVPFWLVTPWLTLLIYPLTVLIAAGVAGAL